MWSAASLRFCNQNRVLNMYGRHGWVFFPFVPFVFLCLSAPANTYLAELQARADERALHEDPYWQVLLHYRSTWRGPVSRIDDPNFFFATDGKTNPRTELQATLAAFFAPLQGGEQDYPVCRFPARLAWLTDALEIDHAQLPASECTLFQRVLNHLKPTSATLIFPAAYMNSPASMFGHTLLVFDSHDQNRLLSRAVNYAAVTQETFGPVFTVKGIIGLYHGYYSIEPYYDLVEKYNDINHRDLWEYELDLTQEEVLRMMTHTWELQNIYSRYFFFTENCSYNLLHLLDAARPSLGLRHEFSSWVIPVDTVKAVQTKGIIRNTVYRPSKSSNLSHLASRAGEQEKDAAWELTRDQRPPDEVLEALPNKDSKILALELAAERVQYLYTVEELSKDVYASRFLKILKRRSKLGKLDTEPPPIVEPSHPETGHDAARLTVATGWRNEDIFVGLKLRPAYHELIDNPSGFDSGAQIQFTNGDVRFYTERDDVEVERFDVVEVVSLAVRDDFFKPTSWKIAAGMRQVDERDDQDRLLGYAHSGSGLAWRNPLGLMAATVDAELQVGGALDQDYAVGAGPALMWIATGSAAWTSRLQAEALWFGLPGPDEWIFRGAWEGQLFRSVNQGVQFTLAHETNGSYHSNEVSVRFNLYF